MHHIRVSQKCPTRLLTGIVAHTSGIFCSPSFLQSTAFRIWVWESLGYTTCLPPVPPVGAGISEGSWGLGAPVPPAASLCRLLGYTTRTASNYATQTRQYDKQRMSQIRKLNHIHYSVSVSEILLSLISDPIFRHWDVIRSLPLPPADVRPFLLQCSDCVDLCEHVSKRACVHVCMCVCARRCACRSVCLSICRFICQSVCLPAVCLSACLDACMHACMYVLYCMV